MAPRVAYLPCLLNIIGASVAPLDTAGTQAAAAPLSQEVKVAIASRLKHHLEAKGLPYDMLDHAYTATASETAEVSHVPGDHLAKSILIHTEAFPFLAVVPSCHMIDLHQLQVTMDRRLGLAREDELAEIFDDCEIGAAPPVGVAYGVPTVLAREMYGLDEIWFEAGDHRSLVHMKGQHFDRLMGGAKLASFCCARS